MADRSRVWWTDANSFTLTASGQAGQVQVDLGAQFTTDTGIPVAGLTVVRSICRWRIENVDTGTDQGAFFIGCVVASGLPEAFDQPALEQHRGRYYLHDAVPIRETGTATLPVAPFDAQGSILTDSRAQAKLSRPGDSWFFVAAMNANMNVTLRFTISQLVLLP